MLCILGQFYYLANSDPSVRLSGRLSVSETRPTSSPGLVRTSPDVRRAQHRGVSIMRTNVPARHHGIGRDSGSITDVSWSRPKPVMVLHGRLQSISTTPLAHRDVIETESGPRLVLVPNNSQQKPRSRQNMDESNQKLLCIIRLYVDGLVSARSRDNDQVDMNDKIAFFVPLIIIYWNHRHPREPLPYNEIDNLLAELGAEADHHRKVLQDVMKSADRQCGGNRFVSAVNTGDFKKAIEAIQILRIWLDESEIFEIQDGAPTSRQSGAKELRLWFESLISLNKKSDSATVQRLKLTQPDLTTSKPIEATTIASRPPAPIDMSPTVTTGPPLDNTMPTTTEPYGMPHYGNRSTTTTESLNRSEVFTTSSPRAVNGTDTTSVDIALINQLHGLSPGATPSRTYSSVLNPHLSQYGEFFEIVSSIIDEINNLHNTTTTLTTEAPELLNW